MGVSYHHMAVFAFIILTSELLSLQLYLHPFNLTKRTVIASFYKMRRCDSVIEHFVKRWDLPLHHYINLNAISQLLTLMSLLRYLRAFRSKRPSSTWRLNCQFPYMWPYASVTQHYSDVIMGIMASQITSLTIVYSTVYSGADQRKHQSSASLAFVREIHRWPVNSPHKWPVTRKMFPFDDVIMGTCLRTLSPGNILANNNRSDNVLITHCDVICIRLSVTWYWHENILLNLSTHGNISPM